MRALIEFRNVSVIRGRNTVLHEINLTIGEGEHVAILGPNGSGKSTLIKLISRELYPVQADGSFLRIFGRDRWDVSTLRSYLGVVSNDIAPFCVRPITGRDAVVSACFSSIGLWPHQHVTLEMRHKAQHLLELLEVSHLADRNVREMSAGETRRVMIARALVHEPRALLFDEPSNSLDISAQNELRETMRKLARNGIGLLLVTHHLPDIVPEIDRVILMRDGRIFADGSKADLLTPETLGSLFGCPVRLFERDGYYHLF